MTDPTSGLQTYVDAWHAAALDVLDLEPADWDVATDLPGWSARDILAHLVHLERVLVDGEEEGPAGDRVPSDYTNAGVDALRGVPVEQLRADLRDLTARRLADLADLPEDGGTPAPRTPAGAQWSWETALRNRAIDMWMHDQDIRRAVDLPGALDAPGAFVTTYSLAFALPYVLGKKVGAPAGTTVRWVVTGPVELDTTIGVGEDGKARPTDAAPQATLTMDTETFIVLAGGRRGPDDVEVVVDGDADLARQVLGAMAVTF